MRYPALFLLLAFLSASACTEEARRQLESQPSAFGEVNQLVVVGEAAVLQSGLGDTVDFIFGGPYPVLPQPEPIFDIRFFTTEELMASAERRQMKNYLILADLNEPESAAAKMVLADLSPEKVEEARSGEGFKTVLAKDKWAKGQNIIYMFGFGREKILKNIQENNYNVIRRLQSENLKKLNLGLFVGGHNTQVEERIRGSLGVTIPLPASFYVAADDPATRTIWVRKETEDISQNIFIHRLPYRSQEQFSLDSIKTLRNNLLKRYVSSEIPDTYVVINDRDLPLLAEPLTLNNYYAVEVRGIWEMENDFMGGPFISFLIHNPSQQELLFVDGFVYAPGEDKRPLIQQLESILREVKF